MVICHDMAQVRSRNLGSSGIVETRYTGILTPESGVKLASDIAGHTQLASGVLIRIDAALLTYRLAPAPMKEVYSKRVKNPAAALIVSPENYVTAVDYCRSMAAVGALRTAWLPGDLELAQNWLALQGKQ